MLALPYLEMDKIYTLVLFLLLFSLDSYSQGIAVSSFRLLDNDLDAITSGTEVLDQNGNKAALIKVVTTETGFNFDCGSLGIVKTEHHPAEFRVYVPAGVRRMTISNQQLGVLRDYQFPIPIEQAKTYEMILNA